MKHIELFCGIGGNRLGLGPTIDTIMAVDMDKKVCETYADNFNDPPRCMKVEDIDHTNCPTCDILTAGAPCQPGSRAGRKMGMTDPRWKTSLDALINCIKISNPAHIIFENVRDFPKYREALNIVFNGFKTLGYATESGYLLATNYGLPQKRERFFILGTKVDTPIFPQKKENKVTLKSVLEHDIENKYLNQNFYLTARRIEGLKAHAERHKRLGHGFGFKVLTEDDVAFTLVVGGMGLERNIVQDPDNGFLRFLTPRECARIQGFPDTFTLPEAKTIAYSQIAEAVPPQMIHAIAEANKWK